MYYGNRDVRGGRGKRRKGGSGMRRKHLAVLTAALTMSLMICGCTLRSPAVALLNGHLGGSAESDIQRAQTEWTSILTEEREKTDNKGEHAIGSGYDYSEPVPGSGRADDSWFDDAVFIGDSRTEGLILNTGLSNAVLYAHKGLTVDTVFSQSVIDKNGEKFSVMDALSQTDFGKVYIMLGLNETGWAYSSIFIEKYGSIIDGIRAINPDCVIYVQEILPVSDEVSQTHSWMTNEKIDELNGLLRQMAEEKQVYFIDTGAAVSDTDGCLPEEAAADGVHLNRAYCEKWLDYLKTHTVSQ